MWPSCDDDRCLLVRVGPRYTHLGTKLQRVPPRAGEDRLSGYRLNGPSTHRRWRRPIREGSADGGRERSAVAPAVLGTEEDPAAGETVQPGRSVIVRCLEQGHLASLPLHWRWRMTLGNREVVVGGSRARQPRALNSMIAIGRCNQARPHSALR
jgi:hypothetical protein